MYLYTNHNADDTYSIKDTIADTTKHFKMEELQQLQLPIVGIFRNLSTGQIVDMHEVQAETVSEPFNCLVYEPKYLPDTKENYWKNVTEKGKVYIQTKEIRDFANAAKRWIPEYIFRVAASSTGKYHSACDLGYQGLIRHTIFVCTNLRNITEIESTRQLLGLTQTEIDLMMVACMFHDTLKEGWDNNIKNYHEHPINAANAIRGMKYFLPDDMLEFIAHCIESHMGQWNTSKYNKTVLPKPSDKYQWLVHISDYLGSRYNISMTINGVSYYKDGEKTECVNKAKQRDKISDTDIKAITKVSSKRVKIPNNLKEELGIERSDDEVYSIWEGLLTYKVATDKQKKYIELAKKLQ